MWGLEKRSPPHWKSPFLRRQSRLYLLGNFGTVGGLNLFDDLDVLNGLDVYDKCDLLHLPDGLADPLSMIVNGSCGTQPGHV